MLLFFLKFSLFCLCYLPESVPAFVLAVAEAEEDPVLGAQVGHHEPNQVRSRQAEVRGVHPAQVTPRLIDKIC